MSRVAHLRLSRSDCLTGGLYDFHLNKEIEERKGEMEGHWGKDQFYGLSLKSGKTLAQTFFFSSCVLICF